MPTHRDSLPPLPVSRVILASPLALYRAHLDAEKLASWRTPEGMRAELIDFDGRLGGTYHVRLHRLDEMLANPGDPAMPSGIIGMFDELIPDEKIVESVRFEGSDGDLLDPMIVTTTLRAVRDGTKVTISCSDVPPVLAGPDHVRRLETALRFLAMLTE